jgi:hypothetical protein
MRFVVPVNRLHCLRSLPAIRRPMSKKRSKEADSILPFGRAIIHRPTRRVVGPIAPIHKEDWPFHDVADHETLWRYLDFFKFEDLLRTSTLYFARPDSFLDPFEGRFSRGNQSQESKSEQIFRSLYHFGSYQKESAAYHEVHRKVVFISCWHRNTKESREMWSAYTKSSDSVVITTSRKAVKRFLPREIMESAVRYDSLDNPRTEFSHNSIFFYKPSEYRFEREFRLLRSPRPGEEFYFENKEDRFRRVLILLKKVVHRVITHPGANAETKRKVEDLLCAFLPKIRREDSALLA